MFSPSLVVIQGLTTLDTRVSTDVILLNVTRDVIRDGAQLGTEKRTSEHIRFPENDKKQKGKTHRRTDLANFGNFQGRRTDLANFGNFQGLYAYVFFLLVCQHFV